MHSSNTQRPRAVLGISAFYHDSAAAVVVDGQIRAAAQEERFSRIKHDARFPREAVRFVLATSGLSLSDIDAVVFYEKPLLKFERLVETYHALAPRGGESFAAAAPTLIREKLRVRRILRRELQSIDPQARPRLLFSEHHLSHAASAFYPSPFEDAAILTVDGVGEWATSTIGTGEGAGISILKEQRFPHSLGLFYSAVTSYCGFAINDGESKLMGLASYAKGDPTVALLKEKILGHMVSLKEDGSMGLNPGYFPFTGRLTMYDAPAWQTLLNIAPYARGQDSMAYAPLSCAAQEILEEAVLRLAATTRNITGKKNLVLAGGVALNCVANGTLVESGLFEHIWIQPAAGDAGGALGAALAGYHIALSGTRVVQKDDAMRGALLGSSYTTAEVLTAAPPDAKVRIFDDFEELCRKVAARIADGAVVGWFQGSMEWGPRALGNRSILADARNPLMQKRINVMVKRREEFRPFAPALLAEDFGRYFAQKTDSPYMLCAFPVLESVRARIPAVVHVDGTARPQSVDKNRHPRFHALLEAFKEKTGEGLLLNTSLNIRDEPIVRTPEEAYRCFTGTDMDVLVMENVLFIK